MAARVVVLISGAGSNLRALLDAAPRLSYRVCGVVSNRQAAGLGHAEAASVATTVVRPRRDEPREQYDERLARAVDGYSPDFVVLAGFMRILSAPFVERLAGRLVNIHPSLLPKYRGLDVHRRVLAGGDSTSGASVHFVIPELDAGPLLIRGVVPVCAGDDERALSGRVHWAEHTIYPAATGLLAHGRIRLEGGHVRLDDQLLAEPLTAVFNENGELVEWPDGIDR